MGTEVILDSLGEHVVVEEGTSAWLTGTLLDENNDAVLSPLTITLTLMESTTRAVINSVQDVDILASFSGGILKHHLGPADNPIVLPLASLAEGAMETHYAEVIWTYAASTGTATGKKTYEFKVQRCYVPVP